MPPRTSIGPGASLRASASFMPMLSFARSPGGTTCAPKKSAVSTWYGTYSTRQLRSRQSSLTFQPGGLARPRDLGLTERVARDLGLAPRARQRARARPAPWTIATMLATVPDSTRTSSLTSLTPESSDQLVAHAAVIARAARGRSRLASATLMPGWILASPRGGSIVGPKKSRRRGGCRAAGREGGEQREEPRPHLHFCPRRSA